MAAVTRKLAQAEQARRAALKAEQEERQARVTAEQQIVTLERWQQSRNGRQERRPRQRKSACKYAEAERRRLLALVEIRNARRAEAAKRKADEATRQ